MIQLLNRQDEFRKLVTYTKFKEFKPRFDPGVFGENPALEIIPAETVPLLWHTLILEKQTGSWILLEPGEMDLYRGIRKQRLSEFLEHFPEERRERAREFVVRLYWAGLIRIGGEPFFDPHLYDHGPIIVRGHLFLLVPTERCNLSCAYCFAESGPEDRRRMPWRTAKRIVDLVRSFPGRQATLEFAGGEPFLETALLTRIVTYAWRRIPEKDKNVRFIAQTNGTLLDPGLLQLLSRLKISVGMSLDGTAEINDQTRRFANGRGASKAILAALERMQRQGMSCGIICVVTRRNLHRLRENLAAYRSLGLRSVKLNPVFRLGRGVQADPELGIEPGEFLEMQRDYLSYLLEEPEPLSDSNIAHLLETLSSKMHHYRCMRSQCGAGRDFFTFSPNGDIHACSRFRSHPAYRLGNVHEARQLDGLWENNPVLRELQDRHVDRIPRCRECRYKVFCQGGCPIDTHSACGTGKAPHPWCDYYRGIHDALFQAIDRDPAFVGKICPEIDLYRESFSDCVPENVTHQAGTGIRNTSC